MTFGIKRTFFHNKGAKKGRDIILTGIPRSGTTLACKILLECKNIIALNEPMEAKLFKKGQPANQIISNSFTKIRKKLVKKGIAPVRTKNGQITDNAYSSDNKSRVRVLERTQVKFDKILSRDFTLVMKHCAEFSLVLSDLLEDYECYAIIRNPLSLLASWNTVNVPVSRGKVAKSRILLPEFYRKLESINLLEEKQYFILNWYFKQFEQLPNDCIISYEDIVESQGKKLSIISNDNILYSSPLSNKNDNQLYLKDSLIVFANMLINRGGNFEKFYSRDDIKKLAGELGI